MTRAVRGGECPRAIVIDWDGTVLRSHHALRRAYRSVTERYLGERIPGSPSEENLIFQLGDREALRLLSTPMTILPAMRAGFRDAYRRAGTEATVLYPRARETLTALRERGWRLGLLANAEEDRVVEDALRLEIHGLFDAVVTNRGAPSWAPHPAALQSLLGLLDVTSSRCLTVGDGQDDIVAGRSAGTWTALARYGHLADRSRSQQADFVLDSLEGLVAVAAALERRLGP